MELPRLAPTVRSERADAARNRQRVLRAAEALFARYGAANVSMEDVARAAGVGKGTLYRRYSDRAALAVALLDEHERDLQDRMLRGDPPLGPGAGPAERLVAFYAALVDLVDRHLDLALAAETGASRFRTGAYQAWVTHIGVLLQQAGVVDPDGTLAEVLLAPLASELYRHLRETGRGRQEIVVALSTLASRVL